MALGSPPHTRGILPFDCTDLVVDGITPAYAGNTRSYEFFLLRCKDHPRIRGEYKRIF